MIAVKTATLSFILIALAVYIAPNPALKKTLYLKKLTLNTNSYCNLYYWFNSIADLIILNSWGPNKYHKIVHLYYIKLKGI